MNLKNSEKRLLMVLLAAVIGGGYFFLVHENLERSIQDAESRILDETIEYDSKTRRISELPELRAYLEELENLPDYAEIFFSASEKQETFMGFLHDLIVDNELMTESIAFNRQKIYLHRIEELAIFIEGYLAGENPEWVTSNREGILPYLEEIGAHITFFVDVEAENLLNVLDTIERHQRMIVCPELVVALVNASAIPPPLRSESIQEQIDNPDEENPLMMLRCVARISCFRFVDSHDQEGWDENEDMDLTDETEVHWEY